jgi:hypothetical protein
MPIRLNLLAEAQALEDLRRRDPVKRAILAAVCVGALLVAWALSLQCGAFIARMDLSRMETRLNSHTNAYRLVLDNQKKLTDANQKLAALRRFAASRFLQGNLLNALQQTALLDVQLTKFRSEQSYAPGEDPKAAGEGGKSTTERTVLSLEARDNSAPNPGDKVNEYKKTILDCPYFQSALGKTNQPRLVSISPPRTTSDGKPFVTFAFECRFADKTR